MALMHIIHQIFAIAQSIKSLDLNLIDQINNRTSIDQSNSIDHIEINLLLNTDKATLQSHIIAVHPTFDPTDINLA